MANAKHVKKVPGRKTDVKDAEWIADLLCHGLLRSSFVPPKPIRELRDLTRYRRKVVESQAAERNRLLKLLETANIKLASVATDVFGVSGRLMLRTLIKGKNSPQEMAALAKGRLRNKISELEPALEGKVEEHHRFLLRLQLERLQAADKDLAVLEQPIQEKLKPLCGPARLVAGDPGRRLDAGGSDHRGIGRGHERVRDCFTAGLLGGRLSGEQRICRQAQEQPHLQGQYLFEDGSGGGSQRGGKSQGYLSAGQVLQRPGGSLPRQA